MQRDEQVAERAALRLRGAQVNALVRVERGFERRHRQHLRRRAKHGPDSLGARKAVFEAEGRGVSEPAGEGLVDRRKMAFGDVDMRGRAGSAIEKLVAAAHREIGARLIQAQFDRPRGVRKIPNDQRAVGLRRSGHRRHVLDLRRAIVDMGKFDDRSVGIDRACHVVRRLVADREAEHSRHAVDDMIVRREVAAFREDDLAVRPHARRGDEQLEQIDRDRVGHRDLKRRRAEQRRELCPDAAGRFIPACLVPGADEAVAPFAFHDAFDMPRHVRRQRAERIAVEIVDAFGKVEPRAERRERILRVKAEAILARDRHDDLRRNSSFL